MNPRLLWLLVMVMCLNVTGLAQTYNATFNNAPAETAIQILKKSTNHDFVYQKDLIKNNKATVTGKYNDMSLSDLLNATVEQQLGLSYKVVGSTVSLSEADKRSYAFDTTVHGTVTDEEGEPLAGATVMLKGTHYGVSADIDRKSVV